jgi:acyl carrier protein
MITEQKIREILGTVCADVDAASLPADGSFKDLGLDSLDQYQLIVELQTLAGREVSDADAERLTTIRALVDYFK